MKPAISVRDLGKCYRIVHQTGKTYRTLRDDIADHAKRILTGQWKREESGEDFWALRDISFDIQPGEVVGVIGRNGAGKSTLLKTLCRITPPTKGEIIMRGRVGSLLEVGTGFHPELTGRENIFLSGAILGMKRREVLSKFDEIVAFAEVERFLDTPVKRYSSGMYVRLAFAVAAHLDTEILLVDEVLAVGDVTFQKKCLDRMKAVGESGRTVIFISHNLGAVLRLCPRSILLQRGMLQASGATEEVLNIYIRDASAKTDLTLKDVRERSGSGAIKLISFHLEDSKGNQIHQIPSGSDFSIVIGFECPSGEKVRDVDLGISIHLEDESILSVVYASYVDQKFETLPAEGKFRCQIKRLPLSPGRYKVGARVLAGGQEADWPRSMVGTLEVIEGDFYGTGHRGFEGTAPLMIVADWSCR